MAVNIQLHGHTFLSGCEGIIIEVKCIFCLNLFATHLVGICSCFRLCVCSCKCVDLYIRHASMLGRFGLLLYAFSSVFAVRNITGILMISFLIGLTLKYVLFS